MGIIMIIGAIIVATVIASFFVAMPTMMLVINAAILIAFAILGYKIGVLETKDYFEKRERSE